MFTHIDILLSLLYNQKADKKANLISKYVKKERTAMKKVFALILTIALLLTSVAAFAETHPTPNVSSFAQLTVKTSDTAYSL